MKNVLPFFFTVAALCYCQLNDVAAMNNAGAGELYVPPHRRPRALTAPLDTAPAHDFKKSMTPPPTPSAHFHDSVGTAVSSAGSSSCAEISSDDSPYSVLNGNYVYSSGAYIPPPLRGIAKVNGPILDVGKIILTPSATGFAEDMFRFFAFLISADYAELKEMENDLAGLFFTANFSRNCFVSEAAEQCFDSVRLGLEADFSEDPLQLAGQYKSSVWSTLICLAWSGNWLTPSFSDEVDQAAKKLHVLLQVTAKKLLKYYKSNRLFRDPVGEEVEASKDILEYLNGRGIFVNDVKFIKPSADLDNSDIKVSVQGTSGFFEEVVRTFSDLHSHSGTFYHFIHNLPAKFNIRERQNNCYCRSENSIDLNFNVNDPLFTLFPFPGAKRDASGRYLFHPNDYGERFGKMYLMEHELGHLMHNLLWRSFDILNEDDSTMKVASCVYTDKASAAVRCTLPADIAVKKIRRGADFPLIIHGMPVPLKNVQKYLEECCASRTKIANLLFDSEDEVTQILGFRVYDGTLFVRKLCDLTFFAEQGLPVRTDHGACFSSAQDLVFGAACPEKYVDFRNLELNREFMPLLFRLHGLDMNEYEKRLMGKI